ncbi:hypothetical protein HN51_062165, partial [Arachis hypogaea]
MSSSHYTKNGRNVMLKITSNQTASSPDSNASEIRKEVRLEIRSVVKAKASDTTECAAMVNTNFRRDFLGLALGISSLFVGSLEAKGAGLSPEDKPKLCDEACEKELENVCNTRILKLDKVLVPQLDFRMMFLPVFCLNLIQEKKRKINAEKKRTELEKERAKDELLTRKRQREERRVRYRVQCDGPKAACAGCAGFGAFSV